MTTKTALNHLHRFEEYFASIMSIAEISGLSHEWIMEEMKRKIYNDPAYGKLPRWATAQFFGHTSTVFKHLHFPTGKLTWVHIWEGVPYSGWDAAPEPCKQAMRDNKGDSAHVWTRHLPAIKRFSTSSPVA